MRTLSNSLSISFSIVSLLRKFCKSSTFADLRSLKVQLQSKKKEDIPSQKCHVSCETIMFFSSSRVPCTHVYIYIYLISTWKCLNSWINEHAHFHHCAQDVSSFTVTSILTVCALEASGFYKCHLQNIRCSVSTDKNWWMWKQPSGVRVCTHIILQSEVQTFSMRKNSHEDGKS